MLRRSYFLAVGILIGMLLALTVNALAGVKCTVDQADKMNPDNSKPRPVLLKVPDANGNIREFDLSPALVSKIVESQSPEFLLHMLRDRTVERYDFVHPGSPVQKPRT